MNTHVEGISFAIAAAVGIVVQLTLGSVVATFIATVISAFFVYQLFAVDSGPDFVENSG